MSMLTVGDLFLLYGWLVDYGQLADDVRLADIDAEAFESRLLTTAHAATWQELRDRLGLDARGIFREAERLQDAMRPYAAATTFTDADD